MKSLLAVTVALCLAVPAMADDNGTDNRNDNRNDNRVAELERRIAELETMVQALLERSDTDVSQAMLAAERAASEAAAARAEADAASQRVADLSDRSEPVLAEAAARVGKAQFSFGGFVKADFIASVFDDGEVAGDSLGRDFFVPAIVPIGGDSSTNFDAHVRQTRFNFSMAQQLDEHALRAFIELDFLTTPGGTERTTNNFQPRLRHAFVSWNNWLVGQTWNTIMDVATLPESADFIGPTSGTSFGRSPMIRYTRGNFAIALENPESSITPLGGGRIETDDNKLPELAARYTWRGDWGHVQLGGMLRQLAIDSDALGLDETTAGWGVSLSGKMNFGRDDLRWMAHYGDGMGRHLALNFANGAAVTDRGTLTTIETVGGFLAYRHWWNAQWRSTATLGWIHVDNPVQFTGQGVNKSSWNTQINLFYSPAPPLSFGIEYLFAEREIESGAKGQLNRFQFTSRYSF
ncbi:MAG: DcaP family trimeric outer membrane transporter [Wenzhouxiangellaceae bacterium]